MSLVERTLDTGLILTEYGQDHASLERALKRRDPLLSLQGWPSQAHGCILWKVVRYAGPDRPPDTVCVWQSDRGEPYPLSSGILTMLDRLDRNVRAEYRDEDAANAERRRELAKKAERDNEAVHDLFKTQWKPGHAALLPRSQSLRMSRDKRRARGEKI